MRYVQGLVEEDALECVSPLPMRLGMVLNWDMAEI